MSGATEKWVGTAPRCHPSSGNFLIERKSVADDGWPCRVTFTAEFSHDIGILIALLTQYFIYRHHFKITPHSTASLGTVRFEHLPANLFLALLPKKDSTITANNSTEDVYHVVETQGGKVGGTCHRGIRPCTRDPMSQHEQKTGSTRGCLGDGGREEKYEFTYGYKTAILEFSAKLADILSERTSLVRSPKALDLAKSSCIIVSNPYRKGSGQDTTPSDPQNNRGRPGGCHGGCGIVTIDEFLQTEWGLNTVPQNLSDSVYIPHGPQLPMLEFLKCARWGELVPMLGCGHGFRIKVYMNFLPSWYGSGWSTAIFGNELAMPSMPLMEPAKTSSNGAINLSGNAHWHMEYTIWDGHIMRIETKCFEFQHTVGLFARGEKACYCSIGHSLSIRRELNRSACATYGEISAIQHRIINVPGFFAPAGIFAPLFRFHASGVHYYATVQDLTEELNREENETGGATWVGLGIARRGHVTAWSSPSNLPVPLSAPSDTSKKTMWTKIEGRLGNASSCGTYEHGRLAATGRALITPPIGVGLSLADTSSLSPGFSAPVSIVTARLEEQSGLHGGRWAR
ncbi:hypothetical protein DFH07DRAFT_942688 [Mycena maculata]|uniref:Uncharacterized protein n=1 Tax=Mycena maculata TaxID=230809 RepID=A0AAD7INE8_9AGAR|nr:hypothetical protein DFH07DRAFT_942688 [Mycena maculata]